LEAASRNPSAARKADTNQSESPPAPLPRWESLAQHRSASHHRDGGDLARWQPRTPDCQRV